MDRDGLVSYLDEHLDVASVQDMAFNGLQVAGRPEVNRLATAVSASAQLFQDAADWGADAVLVHHGLLWGGGEPQPLIGSLRERVRLLLQHELSLIAYHLPLDRHLDHGNAAVMARAIGLDQLQPFGNFGGLTLGYSGALPTPLTLEELAVRVQGVCKQEPLVFPSGRERVSFVGVVTGGAPAAFDEAVASRLDAFITGEAREWVLHRSVEDGVSLIAAGHYATERFGAQALGAFVAKRFGLEVRFFDYPNPA